MSVQVHVAHVSMVTHCAAYSACCTGRSPAVPQIRLLSAALRDGRRELAKPISGNPAVNDLVIYISR